MVSMFDFGNVHDGIALRTAHASSGHIAIDAVAGSTFDAGHFDRHTGLLLLDRDVGLIDVLKSIPDDFLDPGYLPDFDIRIAKQHHVLLDNACRVFNLVGYIFDHFGDLSVFVAAEFSAIGSSTE